MVGWRNKNDGWDSPFYTAWIIQRELQNHKFSNSTEYAPKSGEETCPATVAAAPRPHGVRSGHQQREATTTRQHNHQQAEKEDSIVVTLLVLLFLYLVSLKVSEKNEKADVSEILV